MAESNKINDIIQDSLKNIRDLVDGDTVIGTPITGPDGTVIIPVSKISVGLASGGLDLFNKAKEKAAKKAAAKTPSDAPAAPVPSASEGSEEASDAPDKNKGFGGGGGTGVTVTPLGFLVMRAGGSVELLSLSSAPTPASTISGIIQSAPDLISRVKDIFGKNKKSDDGGDDGADRTDKDSPDGDGKDKDKK